jgi:type VI protein secretion system component VasF
VAISDPETLVREIERTRSELARTVDAIADRVSPSNAARRAAAQIRSQAARVDPPVAAAAAVVLVVGTTAFFVWRRRRR